VFELSITLEGVTDANNAMARAWIDDQLRPSLVEAELALSRRGELEWSATFAIPKATLFAYRIGLLAQPGAVWHLQIREYDAGERTLLEDGDVLTTCKEWLLGTCDVS
jgi:hypothetical protein